MERAGVAPVNAGSTTGTSFPLRCSELRTLRDDARSPCDALPAILQSQTCRRCASPAFCLCLGQRRSAHFGTSPRKRRGQPRAELRPTGSPSWRSWRGAALRSPPKSRVSDTPPPLDGDLVATVGRATSEKHCAGTPRPRPDLAGLLAMRPRSSRVRPADARSSHVLPRWVRVPCGSSTGCEVDRVREDRGRPGTPDGGVHVHLTRAHLR